MSNVNTENNKKEVADTVVTEEKATKKNKQKRIHEKPSWKKLVKVGVALLLVVVLLVVALSVAFGNPDDLEFSDECIVSSDPQKVDTSKGLKGSLLSDTGMTVFADNGKLRLEYSPKDDLFLIVDLSTGRVFRSYPEPTHEGLTNEKGEAIASNLALYDTTKDTGMIITSPVFIGYTKSGMDGGFTKGINQMNDVTKTVNFIKDGVQLVYEVGELALRFTVEITLDGNCLKYKVPRNGIVERETEAWEEDDKRPLLTSLAVLPYLGAHKNGDTGYYVSPDGSGALTYFDVARVNNYNEYSKRVYGIDPTFDRVTEPDFAGENLSVGAYGMVDEEYMITSFIDQGDVGASLKIANPGVRNLPFYSIYYQYNYRYFYKLQISKSGSNYDMVIADMQIGDVEQSMYFDAEPEFDASESKKETAFTYVDVAEKTRTLLLNKWSSVWGVDKKALEKAASVIDLRFMMGAETVSGGVLDELKVMTTFEDVREIYEDLEKAGLKDLALTLRGWTSDGYYWNSTTKNKVESDFGGKSGLIKLNKWAADKGIQISLDNNLLTIYGSPNGWSGATLRNSVVKLPNSFYLNYESVSISGRYNYAGYWMSPKYFNNELLKGSISRLESYKTQGVTLQQLGDMLYTDYNEENAMLRIQTAHKYVDWLKQYKNAFNRVSVYYGYDYAAAVADSVMDMPMDRSSHIVLDESVPFMQIVYHGLVNYYTAPINNQDSAQYALLKAVEYGANLSYEVTKAETKELQYTNYLELFKAQYSLLKDEIIDAYRMAAEAIQPFACERITNHEQVDAYKDVFCTTYSGGARVYVNYTDTDYTLTDGTVVPSMNYLVVNG